MVLPFCYVATQLYCYVSVLLFRCCVVVLVVPLLGCCVVYFINNCVRAQYAPDRMLLFLLLMFIKGVHDVMLLSGSVIKLI